MRNNTFEEIAKVLEDGEVFLIFPHIIIDGDALGSATALCHGLRSMGKKAYIVLEDSVAKNLEFLKEDCCIEWQEVDFNHDVSICLDCSEEKRFPKRAELFKRANKTICIDHHITSEYFCEYNYIDSSAAATAELVYEVLKKIKVDITSVIAKSIFIGITTDTGNFQYSNTTKKTHKIVAELYDICSSFNDVSNSLYENDSFERLALQGEILNSAELFACGRGIISCVTQDMLKKTKSTMEDSEGCVSRLRAVKGVNIAVLLKEEKSGKIKASLRAKEEGDVASICRKFGGGGHLKAAGFTIEKTLKEVKKIIIEEVEKSLE